MDLRLNPLSTGKSVQTLSNMVVISLTKRLNPLSTGKSVQTWAKLSDVRKLRLNPLSTGKSVQTYQTSLLTLVIVS